jgi:hypothetical protein
MAVFYHDGPSTDAVGKDALDGPRHGSAGLAGTHQQDTVEPVYIHLLAADFENFAGTDHVTVDGGFRIDGVNCGLENFAGVGFQVFVALGAYRHLPLLLFYPERLLYWAEMSFCDGC